jgi:hypothetical protein
MGDQMAAPTYSQQFSIGLLGTVGNLLSQPMNFYRCATCGAVVAEGQTGTTGRDLHTGWHAGLDTTATSASTAVTTANAAKTAATGAATAASSASSAAAQALTSAQKSTTTADAALAMAQVALPGADVTLCPLCRATVNTNDLRVHLTYHYRRAHGDPVEFPEDFDPSTQDMAQVDPPMRVSGLD